MQKCKSVNISAKDIALNESIPFRPVKTERSDLAQQVLDNERERLRMGPQASLPFIQDAELARVRSKMAKAVLKFCQGRLGVKAPRFHAEDLRRYLSYDQVFFAPGSPDRILRDLRKRGLIAYVVRDRRQSIYELTWAAE